MKSGTGAALSDKKDDFIEKYVKNLPSIPSPRKAGTNRYKLPRFGKPKAVKRGKPCLRKAILSPYNRRVFVVTYHYRMAFGGLSKLHSHLRYVERPEAQANVKGEKSNGDRLFDANGAIENGHAVVQTWKDDRHHFRIIISPNDGHELDMHKLVRDVMRDIEKGVGTKLDWMAAVHEKPDKAHAMNRHAHIILRGICDDGSDLVMKRDFIMHEIRRIASDFATDQIGIIGQREADRFAAMAAEKERTGDKHYHSGFRPMRKAKDRSNGL